MSQIEMWNQGGARVGAWQTFYTKDRSDGTRVSVSLPPKRDAVLIRVGTRTVALQLDEVVNVEYALRAAREVGE